MLLREGSPPAMVWYSPLRVDTAKALSFVVISVLLLGPRLSSAQSQATFAVFADASDIYPLPRSPACADALASSLQCPETIVFAVPSSSNPISNLTASDLNALCAPTCYQSLVSTAAAVDSACAGWPYILGDTSYVASFPQVPHQFECCRPAHTLQFQVPIPRIYLESCACRPLCHQPVASSRC